MILSRPYEDDDEMLEDERLFHEWAHKLYGNCQDYAYDDTKEIETNEYDFK